MISNKLISHLPLGRVDGEIDVFVLHISWIVRQLGTDRPSSCSLIVDTPTRTIRRDHAMKSARLWLRLSPALIEGLDELAKKQHRSR